MHFTDDPGFIELADGLWFGFNGMVFYLMPLDLL